MADPWNWLKEEIDKLHEKQDKMTELLLSISYRSEEQSRKIEVLEQEIKPLKKQSIILAGGVKLLALSGAILTIIKGIQNI